MCENDSDNERIVCEMNLGIADDNDLLGGMITPVVEEEEPVILEKLTVENVLGVLGSGLGLDVAKNHTGICIYRDGKVERYGFAVKDYDKDDYHADYRMRLDFKNKLKEIIQGMEFNYCIIEDVYGGENYDTVRKLIVLNTVIDELIFEGTVKVKEFYRWAEARWLKYFKKAHKCQKGLKSKIATQEILGVLGDSFYLENKDNPHKAQIFFEDKCDATAMLCGLAIFVSLGDTETKKAKRVTLKNIKMYYLEDDTDYLSVPDDRVRYDDWTAVDGEFDNLERKIIDEAETNPDTVLTMELPVAKLGRFGIEHHFTFYPSGKGVLIWYLKH